MIQELLDIESTIQRLQEKADRELVFDLDDRESKCWNKIAERLRRASTNIGTARKFAEETTSAYSEYSTGRRA